MALDFAAGAQTLRGVVVDLEQHAPPPDATLREKESYDPWESVVVQWAGGEWARYECCCVGEDFISA